MQDLEKKTLKLLPCKLAAYYRYVDDIFYIAPITSLNIILTIFNSFYAQLQFTMEVEQSNKISFFNVSH